MAAKEQPEESSEEPSRAAGACVLVVLAGVATAAMFAASPTVGVLALWVVGAVLLWRSVRRTANPAPPPPPERGSDANPQFTVTEDRPGHCIVHWQKEVGDA